ncbi:probable cytochrome P450 313a1 [Anopheles albimanus]|uniref:probable cytochrome P450 313a1 n=1 Tax=Anopheles albimanus TaxID=7167 RepID=UPI00163F8437|nr:probable cytochrome P450 313a1 [Anopheles albimanus]
MTRILNPFLYPDWIYRWTSTYRKEQKALEEYHQPARDILVQQKKSLPTVISGFMSPMKKKHHEDTEMLETNISGFIYAGHETSSITISNTLLFLAMHPDVQEQVVAEIRQHCGALGEDIRYETLQELVYLEMVLKESLRLLPIAPFVGRKPTQDISIGKYILPAGVDVLINIFSIHRNPTYWGEDADQFRPERFATKTYDRSTYLPFSAGMRNCIGEQYAMISMKIMLIKILTSYRLDTDLQLKDLRMKLTVTMKINNGYMVRLARR